MLRAEGRIVIEAEPQAILEFVLDLERYRLADTKVGAVKQSPDLDADGRGRVRYRGRLRGIRTPVDTQEVLLEPGERLTIRGAPGVWTRWTTDFEGTFACERTTSGTRVTHIETFRFRPAPLRWLAEAYLRRWLDDAMVEEMAAMKRLIEQDAPRPSDDGAASGSSASSAPSAHVAGVAE